MLMLFDDLLNVAVIVCPLTQVCWLPLPEGWEDSCHCCRWRIPSSTGKRKLWVPSFSSTCSCISSALLIGVLRRLIVLVALDDILLGGHL